MIVAFKHLSWAFWLMPAYLVATLLLGWVARGRNGNTAEEYLNAGRSLPLPVVVIAYIAANCGALELVGLTAVAAQYGVQAFHFYWIGAIPALVFLALFMMPVYRRSGIRSVPEYLLFRFGPRLRFLNAAGTAIVLLLLAGISLYAMAQVLEVMLAIPFLAGALACSCIVLIYVLVGGIRATIFNEVLQLAVILAGLIPLAIYTSNRALLVRSALLGIRGHLWTALPLSSPRSPSDVLGVAAGLGFVLSFGYWCTDFIMMQRAFTARTEHAACAVPLWAGFGKLAFSLIVVLPGVAAIGLLPELGVKHSFDQTLPMLMERFYGPRLLAVGLTALAASLMSGLAANVAGFASIWTEDIYRAALRPSRTERQYMVVGRYAVVAAVVCSILLSYLNFLFADLMEHVQLIFSVFGSPFWAVFLLGMGTRRADERGCIAGFASGAGFSFVHSLLFKRGFLHYGSTMTANFYAAIFAFAVTAIVGLVVSRAQNGAAIDNLVFSWHDVTAMRSRPLLWSLAACLLLCCLLLNILWR